MIIRYITNQTTTAMTKRKTYHVTPTEDGWQGKLEGGGRASVTGTTKDEVMKATIDMAKNAGNSSVIIHKKDGEFQEERTYPKGSDPYPPPG